MFKFFLALFLRSIGAWVGFFLARPVNWTVFFNNALRHANALPLWSLVVHPVHEFTMATDVLRIYIRTVPIRKSGLFANHTFTLDKLAISQHVSSSLRDTSFILLVNHLQVAVKVNSELAINLMFQRFF